MGTVVKYESLTDEANQVMFWAGEIAKKLGYDCIGTETILVALLSANGGDQNRAERLIRSMGTSSGRVIFETLLLIKKFDRLVTVNPIPLTPRAKKVIEFAIGEAKAHHLSVAGPEYLLLGLLLEQDGVAAQVLMNLDLNVREAREQLLVLNDEDSKRE
ncbi:MAG: Clp protease N-terminal domain-containing protein [Patescibacteria group bacterium]